MIEPETHTLRVELDGAGKRLDLWLTRALETQSRSSIRRRIEGGDVLVDGERVKPSHVLRGGETVVVSIPPPATPLPQPEEIPLDVVFEDEHLVVVNKSPGLVVHPGRGNPSGTLVNALLHHCPDVQGVGGVQRPGIVHRLDRGTSGLLIAAKSDRAHSALTEAMRRRKIRRRYEAIVWGDDAEPAGVIEGPIGRDPANRVRMAVLAGGRSARTHFEVRARGTLTSRLSLRLETGRTHQIRVHLASRGWPVIGDSLYGGMGKQWINRLHRVDARAAAAVRQVGRPMLHAAALTFDHPITGNCLQCDAEPPGDFQGLASALGLRTGIDEPKPHR
jgi:23S rRNA pseudouridine1911/1915/1917 synthase